MSELERHRAVGQVKEVTSLANPLVKDIRALAMKKFRDQQHAFMAEGLKLVIDALDAGWTIRTLVFAKNAKENPAVRRAAARTVASGGLVLEASEKVLSGITRRDNPQMVVGVFEQRLLPLAVVLTAYSIRASFFAIHALMRDIFAGMGGTVESGELVIVEKTAGRKLSTSLFSRWVAK
jgi:hypothetical protein